MVLGQNDVPLRSEEERCPKLPVPVIGPFSATENWLEKCLMCVILKHTQSVLQQSFGVINILTMIDGNLKAG